MRAYWPVPEAAKLLELVTGKRVSTAVLYRLIREGKLGAIRPAGMRTHIRPADISWARLTETQAIRILEQERRNKALERERRNEAQSGMTEAMFHRLSDERIVELRQERMEILERRGILGSAL